MVKLTPYQEDIYAGKICPYCQSGTKRATETFIYGKEYNGGMMICCINFPQCDSYVGTHKDDGTALGRLANKELRQYKKAAHDNFDKLWRNRDYDRDEVYEMLAEHLGVEEEYCHIGMFNKETCVKVIRWSRSI